MRFARTFSKLSAVELPSFEFDGYHMSERLVQEFDGDTKA